MLPLKHEVCGFWKSPHLFPITFSYHLFHDLFENHLTFFGKGGWKSCSFSIEKSCSFFAIFPSAFPSAFPITFLTFWFQNVRKRWGERWVEKLQLFCKNCCSFSWKCCKKSCSFFEMSFFSFSSPFRSPFLTFCYKRWPKSWGEKVQLFWWNSCSFSPQLFSIPRPKAEGKSCTFLKKSCSFFGRGEWKSWGEKLQLFPSAFSYFRRFSWKSFSFSKLFPEKKAAAF